MAHIEGLEIKFRGQKGIFKKNRFLPHNAKYYCSCLTTEAKTDDRKWAARKSKGPQMDPSTNEIPLT